MSGENIIKDHARHYIRTFLVSYVPCLILEVEFRDILDEILLIRGIRLLIIFVEADSTVATKDV